MKGLAAKIFHYLIRILGLELALALIVGIVVFLRERSLNSFGDWMVWAGVICLVFGLLGVIGYGGMARSGSYQIGQTVGEQDIPTRTNADLAEERRSFSVLELSAGVGILAIAIGVLT